MLTFEVGYKEIDMDFTLVSPPTASADKCFCLFDGGSLYTTAGYLFPKAVGPGKFQPYVRYMENNTNDAGNDTDTVTIGLMLQFY